MTHSQLRPEDKGLFPYVVEPSQLGVSNLTERKGIHRLVMLDRYSSRDNDLVTLKEGDIVVAEVKYDPDYPTQGYGKVLKIDGNNVTVDIEFPESVEDVELPIITVHKSKVIKPLETYWEQICYRAAKGVSSVEKTEEKRQYWFNKFYWMLVNQYAIPGGRILYGAGAEADVTLFNCFVLECIEDSRGGISDHRKTTMEIMSRGGGVGSNGSALRPKDALVLGVNGKSSGSVSWLGDLANLTHLVIQGGSRRGAQMIGLGDWHPDIIAFMMSKLQNPYILDKIIKEVDDKLVKEIAEGYLIRDAKGNPVAVRNSKFMEGANISVLVTHDFMNAVENDTDWVLRFPDIANMTKEQKEFYDKEWHKMGDVRKWEALGLPVQEYHTMKATAMWELINICARYSAEPGVIFIDHCNDMSNSYYYAPLVVTNPCGEQPLPPDAVCNLIAINMAEMKNSEGTDVDYDLFKEVIIVSQRFADNVIDHSFYFLPANEKMATSERRVGKGVMGLADLMIDLKLPYGSDEMLKKTDEVFEFLAVESYLASSDIAEEKGSFPYFDCDKYLESGFLKTMPERVHQAIREKGIRNVCSLTVAPTGSTGTMVGVATGLEPYFSFTYFRSGRLGKWIEVFTEIAQRYFDENPEETELPEWFVASMDITPLAHAKTQGVIQRWIDSAISKTCNAPKGFTVEQNKELYFEAWKSGCKGVTVYVDGSRANQVLSLDTEENTFESEDATQEVAVTTEEVPVEITDEMLTGSTGACKITFDESGNMVKECH